MRALWSGSEHSARPEVIRGLRAPKVMGWVLLYDRHDWWVIMLSCREATRSVENAGLIMLFGMGSGRIRIDKCRGKPMVDIARWRFQ